MTQSDGLAVDLLLAGLPSAFGVYLWVMAINILRRLKSVRRSGGIKADSSSVISSVIASAAVVYSSQRFSSAFNGHKVTALSFAELICLLGSVFDEPAFSITCLRLFLFIAAFVLGLYHFNA